MAQKPFKKHEYEGLRQSAVL